MIMEKKEKSKFEKWMDKWYKWLLLGSILFCCWAIVVPKGRVIQIKVVVPEHEEVEKIETNQEELPQIQTENE